MRVFVPVLLTIAGMLAPEVRALEVSGEITGTQVWRMTDAADTVRITGNVYVRDSAYVAVAPGTVLRGYNGDFLWRYNVYVEGTGRIDLHGTPDSLITFRNVCLEFGRLAPGGVDGISYCAFSDGWGNASLEFRNASVPSGTGDITEMLIEDCVFTSGSYCLSYVTSGARPAFRGCTFTGSDGCGIFVHGGGDAVVESCIFSGLSSAVCCAGMGAVRQWWEPLTMVVDHCTFYDINTRNAGFTTVPAANGYGITTINYPGTLHVRNSIFRDMGESGIRDYNTEDDNFDTNWVVDADYNMYYGLGGDPVRLSSMGAHSRETDPLLADAAAGDFRLLDGSPALGAAADGLDIGAVQAAPVSSVSGAGHGVERAGIRISVRPGVDGVRFSVSGRQSGALVVYDACGNEAVRLPLRERSVAAWRGNAPAGIYYARLTADPVGAVWRFVRL